MPLVAAKQLVGSLSNQSDLHVLSGALGHEIHRHDRGRRHRLFKTRNNPWQRSLEFLAIELDLNVLGPQQRGGLGRIFQLVVFEGLTVSDGVGAPWSAVLVHEREKESRIKAAAKEDAHRNVAQQVTADSGPVEREELASRIFVTWLTLERNGRVAVPPLLRARTILDPQQCSWRELANAFEYRQRRWRVPILEKQVQRERIDIRGARIAGDHRTHFGGERELAIGVAIVDWLDPHRVTRNDEAPPLAIPNRDAEHTVQPLEDTHAPGSIPVNDDFSVGARAEAVPVALQFGA